MKTLIIILYLSKIGLCPTKCPTKRYFWFTLHFVDIKNRNRNPPILDGGFLQRKVVVRPEGLEPSTNGLRGHCSTN